MQLVVCIHVHAFSYIFNKERIVARNEEPKEEIFCFTLLIKEEDETRYGCGYNR